MLLDPSICARARRTHDPRFDGRFFVGVMTTRIYCRSICPARSPKEENVRYFATAAAASEAGLRPCLRCRPEASPGTPAWLGTSATVSRALRLISESALEDGGVESLAERLGIGARHLRRLFLKHLGASPISVAQTRRLHFAKKLIDETSLPMRDVAIASGFGSIRRFNDTFSKVYGRTPTHLRRLARRAPARELHEYDFLLRFRPPFSWRGLLEFLAPRATPGVEQVEGSTYRRIVSLHGQTGWLEASLTSERDAVSLRIHFPEARWLFLIVERVRRMFDLAADPNEIAASLARDPLFRSRLKQRPGLRVPGCWDGFELAVRAILGQQVSVRGATTLAGRLVQKFGTRVDATPALTHLFPTPEKMTDSDLAVIGLPQARAHALRSLARAVCAGTISFSGVVDVDQFRTQFCELPGIGDWTAQYVAMRALNEPDGFPASDLGLLRALNLRDPRMLNEMSQVWRPWRAYAAMYLWQTSPQKTQAKPKLIMNSAARNQPTLAATF
jgi:AraC family transcriptional regulator of adaptative response / DNA-3-methyladenine glycosylase II